MAGEAISGVGYELELTGHEEVLAAIGAVASRMEHPAPLFDIIGALLVTSTQDRFERETDPEGNPWPVSLRVQFEGGSILRDSGLLFQSMAHEASDQGVAVGTDVHYAATHQLGPTTIRPVTARALAFEVGGQSVFAQEVTIPRRAFLGLDDADEEAIEGAVSDYVFEPVGGADAAG